MKKPLAQVAFEAWNHKNRYYPEGDWQFIAEKKDWERAAKAVIREYLKRKKD